MRRPITLAAVIGLAAVLASAALAATGTPFGGATQSNGVLTLVSNTGDSGSGNDASGANFAGHRGDDVLEHRDPVDRVQCHRRRLHGRVTPLPDPGADAVRPEERVRLPRSRPVVLGLLAERVDHVGQPDRLHRRSVRHESGAGRARRCRRTRRPTRSSAASRSPGSRSSSIPAGRSPTRSRPSWCGTSRSTTRRSSLRAGPTRARVRGTARALPRRASSSAQTWAPTRSAPPSARTTTAGTPSASVSRRWRA